MGEPPPGFEVWRFDRDSLTSAPWPEEELEGGGYDARDVPDDATRSALPWHDRCSPSERTLARKELAVLKPRILVAYDFSGAADRALQWAAELSRATGGSVHVVHVALQPETSPLGSLSLEAPRPLELESLQTELRQALQQHGVEASAEVRVSSSPETSLLDACAELRCDLIVMGTRGRGSLSSLVLGSVSEYLTRHAACPVVTLRDAGRGGAKS